MAKLPKFIPRLFSGTPDIHGRIVWWLWWVPFVAVPAVTGWLSSTLPWFWHWFGLFGVTMVALVTAMIVMLTMAAYRHWKSAGDNSTRSTKAVQVAEIVDWAPWKCRKNYTQNELARILAFADPSANQGNTRATAYYGLLTEAVATGALSATKESNAVYSWLVIEKQNAIDWAEKMGLEAGHIK